jgi:hypothetical protein
LAGPDFISRTGGVRFRVGRSQIKQLRLCGKKAFMRMISALPYPKGVMIESANSLHFIIIKGWPFSRQCSASVILP